jgi:hypothetical protein
LTKFLKKVTGQRFNFAPRFENGLKLRRSCFRL